MEKVSIEHFIPRIYTRVDKISELYLNNILKSHILLRKTSIDYHEKQIVIRAGSDRNDDDHRMSAALRNIDRSTVHPNAKNAVWSAGLNTRADHHRQGSNQREANGSSRVSIRMNRSNVERVTLQDRQDHSPNNTNHTQTVKPTIYTMKPFSVSASPSVIIDSGACGCIVSMKTLDRAMKSLNTKKVEDTTVRLQHQRFGSYDDEQPSIFVAKTPVSSTEPNWHVNAEFDVTFDVMDNALSFLLGLSSPIAMDAYVNHKYMTIVFSLIR